MKCRMTKWDRKLFHEAGILNARSIRSDVVHIAADDGYSWGSKTLCGKNHERGVGAEIHVLWARRFYGVGA